jgi:hypothetical protein
VEPTPGYLVLEAPLTFWEKLCRVFAAVIGGVVSHAAVIAPVCALVVAAWCARRRLRNAWVTLLWRLTPASSSRSEVLRTLRLLEHRHCLAVRPRPPDHTLRAWYGAAANQAPREYAPDLHRFSALTSWAVYSPKDRACNAPVDLTAARRICGNAVTYWNYSRIRTSATRKDRKIHD